MSLDPEPPEIDPPTALPVETAIAADQVAAHDTSHGAHGPFHTHCENCATKLDGPYCHKCGQHDFEFHRSFWHVFLEGLESFLHFDSKLFHTVATLIFRPGQLTAEFNAGKRVAQMPPLRLYIFVSLVFFFLFFLDAKSPDRLYQSDIAPSAKVVGDQVNTDEVRQAWKEAREELADKPKGKRAVDIIREAAEKTQAAQLRRAEAAQKAAVTDAAATPASPDHGPPAPAAPEALKSKENSEFLRWLKTQGERAANPEHQHAMAEQFMHAMPKMLLFCLPLFALITRVLFGKARLVYLQHLVLALHFHTLILLWVMMKNGWVFLTDFASHTLAGWVTAIFWIWLLAYPFLMFRRLFSNSWPKTVFKTGLVAAGYGLTLTFAAIIGGFIVFAML